MHTLSPLARRLLCTSAALLALHLPAAHAVMLGPEAAMPPATQQADAERARVKQFLEQADVRQKLQALGVDGLQAKDRVDSLTQEEVHALAQRIDALPAGGRLSDSDLILILLIAILILVAL